MKKSGFTLAEILISLSIIGVVAALTLPSLLSNTQAAQIGPKLGKAVSMFEQASMALLSENDVDAISDAYSTASSFRTALEGHMKVADAGGVFVPAAIALAPPLASTSIKTRDGVEYIFPSSLVTFSTSSNPSDNYLCDITIDINSANGTKTAGEDTFYFGLFDDGSLRPKGGKKSWNGTDNNTWSAKCAKDALPSDATYCAGHIFENNMKVLYK